MKKLTQNLSFKKGRDAGTIVHVGEKKIDQVRMLMIEYNEKKYNICDIEKTSEIIFNKEEKLNLWIDVIGIHDVNLIAEIGEIFGLHPLVLEDVCNSNQRPKLDTGEDYAFITLKILHFNEEKSEILPEHVSIIVSQNFIVTFQETDTDDFLPVIGRILNEHKTIRKSGVDYLAYSLMDSVVDNYLSILEKIGEKIESIEEELMTDVDRSTYNKIHYLQREMIFLRRVIWPVREIIGKLSRGECKQIKTSSKIYFRDVQDHILQILETIDLYREILSGLLGVYLSVVNNRMNKIMKVLTIITTIFIPLSFIAGIYGMNFKHMPETEWRYGYFTVVGFMFFLGFIMLMFFKRKKWF